MSKTDYSEDLVLTWLMTTGAVTRPTAWYVALTTTTPTDAAAGTEVTGGDYARVAATFAAPSGGSTSNSSTVTFPTATANWGTVTHFEVWDALSGGNRLRWGALDTSEAVTTGQTPSFAAGALICTES
jgi:hypothetical protein